MSLAELTGALTSLGLEIGNDGIATLTVNRPEKLNALNEVVLSELGRCISWVDQAEEVRVLIVTGAGSKSFVAGADIAEFRGLDESGGRALARRGQAVFSAIESLGKPVIAAVNGYALGGGNELALACHLRICSTRARFGQPEVVLGLIPGYGGTQRLPRVVGPGPAAEMILTGDPIDAERALALGLVSQVVEPEALLDAARNLALRILSKAPAAVRLALDALRGARLPLEEGLEMEADLFGRACGTEDFREGVDAFLERRKPDFKGR